MWSLSVPGLKVDLPHHRPSGQRRGPNCCVLGARPRGGATTAQRARLPMQQAVPGRPRQYGAGRRFQPEKTRADGSKQAQDRGAKNRQYITTNRDAGLVRVRGELRDTNTWWTQLEIHILLGRGRHRDLYQVGTSI